MKLASIFSTASAVYLRVYRKDTNKRARNMKLASIFFTASAVYLRVYRKDTNKRARNMKLASIFFHCECRVSSRFTAKIMTNIGYL